MQKCSRVRRQSVPQSMFWWKCNVYVPAWGHWVAMARFSCKVLECWVLDWIQMAWLRSSSPNSSCRSGWILVLPLSPLTRGAGLCAFWYTYPFSLQKGEDSELRALVGIWEIRVFWTVPGFPRRGQSFSLSAPQKKWRKQHTIISKRCCRHKSMEDCEALRYYSNQSHTSTKGWHITSSQNQ